MDKIDKAAIKAVRLTNLCTKHMEYHGQKFEDCTPEERVIINLHTPKSKENK